MERRRTIASTAAHAEVRAKLSATGMPSLFSGMPSLFYGSDRGGHGSGVNLQERTRMAALEMT